MDWGLIILAVVGLAFVALVVLAVRRMAAGRPDRYGEDEPASEEPEEPAPDEDSEDEEPEDEAPEEGRRAEAPRRPERRPRREAPAPASAEEQERLGRGLAKTRGGFIARLGRLFSGKVELDAQLLERVEEILFTADIGVRTSQEIIDTLRSRLGKGEIHDPQAIWQHIKRHSEEILQPGTNRPLDLDRARPLCILVIGVNGTGKTTTIGKLAARYKAEGRKVLLAAGDTFRAAATEQLEVWAGRSGCPVVKGKEQADPTSVIVEAIKKAQAEDFDLVIADTAGRLHTKVDLMDELQKVRRAMGKKLAGAPHETWLVLDANTGQNAISQARIFKEALEVTGLVLTKLDGTAKGGVILGITNELRLPVRFIGIGEKIDDLRPFDPQAFVEALYQRADEEGVGPAPDAAPGDRS